MVFSPCPSRKRLFRGPSGGRNFLFFPCLSRKSRLSTRGTEPLPRQTRGKGKKTCLNIFNLSRPPVQSVQSALPQNLRHLRNLFEASQLKNSSFFHNRDCGDCGDSIGFEGGQIGQIGQVACSGSRCSHILFCLFPVPVEENMISVAPGISSGSAR